MKELLRENIRNLTPYKCARDDFSASAEVYLDANENFNDFNLGSNRYPDPVSTKLREKIEEVWGLEKEKTVILNGSDEAIDSIIRMFCGPGKDKIMILPPTYGVYKVFAATNDVGCVEVPLDLNFEPDIKKIKTLMEREENKKTIKVLFVCSPNNPTSNVLKLEKIEEVLSVFPNMVVVDEAYWDFSGEKSAVELQEKYPNLIVLRTFSKCWALSGARLGVFYSGIQLCKYLKAIKAPYNVSIINQKAGLQILEKEKNVKDQLKQIIKNRKEMEKELKSISCVSKVFPSDTNFLLVKVSDADKIYDFLSQKGIIVRNRSRELNCYNCLRFTVGSQKENEALIEALKNYGGENESK